MTSIKAPAKDVLGNTIGIPGKIDFLELYDVTKKHIVYKRKDSDDEFWCIGYGVVTCFGFAYIGHLDFDKVLLFESTENVYIEKDQHGMLVNYNKVILKSDFFRKRRIKSLQKSFKKVIGTRMPCLF